MALLGFQGPGPGWTTRQHCPERCSPRLTTWRPCGSNRRCGPLGAKGGFLAAWPAASPHPCPPHPVPAPSLLTLGSPVNCSPAGGEGAVQGLPSLVRCNSHAAHVSLRPNTVIQSFCSLLWNEMVTSIS